jgi:hypothetical protein
MLIYIALLLHWFEIWYELSTSHQFTMACLEFMETVGLRSLHRLPAFMKLYTLTMATLNNDNATYNKIVYADKINENNLRCVNKL